jgi:hypothetical protein
MSERRERQIIQLIAKAFAKRLNALSDAPLQVEFDGSEGRGTSHRVAKKRGGMERFAGGSGPSVHNLCPPDAGRHGKSCRQPFSETKKVGVDAELITGKKRAGAIESSINLVEDEQDLVGVANLAQHSQEIEWRDHFTAAPLAGFDQDASDWALANGLDNLILDGS